jgi:ETC complex I subunit conserved region
VYLYNSMMDVSSESRMYVVVSLSLLQNEIHGTHPSLWESMGVYGSLRAHILPPCTRHLGHHHHRLMTSIFRLTRQIRPIPIPPLFIRHASTKPIVPTQPTADVPIPAPPPEDKTPIPADIVSGAPEDLHRRTVRIYKPSKGAMQSGLHGNLFWRVDWDVRPDDNKWEHPVMYWASR